MKTIALELTTKCNFSCDYCYTKNYDDAMMSVEMASAIVDQWRGKGVRFSLSGEGESLLHPQFWEIVRYIRKTDPSAKVTTITNGSTLSTANRKNVIKYLDHILISLDTVDKTVADFVGRHMLDKVLSNITKLAAQYPNIIILTTDFGQNLVQLHKFIRGLPNGSRINIETQPLQSKADYVTAYTKVVPVVVHTPTNKNTVACSFIQQQHMVMYSVTGQKMPCCFIKNRALMGDYEQLVQQLTSKDNTKTPACCAGCRYLKYTKTIDKNCK